MTGESVQRPPARVDLQHLDNLWIQAAGTLCNIECRHCFNNSGPRATAFGHMTFDTVAAVIAAAEAGGVREIYFTGGEPFLNPHLADMIAFALAVAPTTILTNGMLIGDRLADRLAAMSSDARYSLEVRISLDGHTEAMNDAIRGRGVFRLALAAVARLARRNVLPLVTIVRTWDEMDELVTLAAFTKMLRNAGCDRPRIKVLPSLPLGRELIRVSGLKREEYVTQSMLDGFDRDLLMCSNSRVATDRGVWVCPLLVEHSDARLGDRLADASASYELRHQTCVTCWQHRTICSNVTAGIEGPYASALEKR